MKISRTGGLPVLVVLLASTLLFGACSNDESADTIPSSDDVVTTLTTQPAVDTTSTTVTVTDPEEVSRLFSACMRDEGIDFPDIGVDAEGRPAIGDALDSLDMEDPAFQRALTSCSSILADTGALDLSSDPELQAAIVDQLSSFSQCMRTEGVEEFPDPSPGFTGSGSPYPFDEIPLTDPQFQTAIDTCGADLGSIGLDS